MNFKIKPFDKTSSLLTKQVYEIQVAAYKTEADLLKAKDFPPLDETLLDLESSNDEGFVALENLSPIGAIFLEKIKMDFLISKLVVSPAHFRKGIAKKLVQHVLDLHSKSTFHVSTGADNSPAIHLYESFGFVQENEILIKAGIKIIKMQRAAQL